MAKPTKRQCEFLRDNFLRASGRWPGLHHTFIQLEPSGGGELNFFLETWPTVVVAPVMAQRVVLKHTVSLHDSLASGRLGITVYIDDPPPNPSGLLQFRELALSACRCFFPKTVDQYSHAHGYNWFLPDKWLGELYMLGLENRDPLLAVREHRMELRGDGSKFHLTPGFSSPIPEGNAIGFSGQFRSWKGLLADLAESGVRVDVLETGVFRASAYALDQYLTGEWRIGAPASKSKRGRPRDPSVAARSRAIIDEYERDSCQEHSAIADKVAPMFPGLPCSRDQVRKAIYLHESLKQATGKK